MSHTVLIPEDIDPTGKDFLRERGYAIKMGSGASEDDIVRDVVDCDAILVRNARYTRRIMEAGNRLRVIGRHGTGVDNIDLDAATELGIQVVNTPTANIDAVAEFALAMTTALVCGLFPIDRETRRGNWNHRLTNQRRDLRDLTLGVVGFGRVGRTVAAKARAGFGMRILALDKSASPDGMPEGMTLASSLEELLTQADVVTLHTPSTPETRGLIRRETLAQMKPTAFLVNCARGDICVEADLAEALRNGVIAGAALDVFESEPLPEGHPFLSLDNIILSQHCAGLSAGAAAMMAYGAAVGIDEVLSGRAPTNPVNTPRIRKDS